jgi:hypothetical protein
MLKGDHEGGIPAMTVPFSGPLHAEWGDRMRAAALRDSLTGARSRVRIPTAGDRAWTQMDALTLDEIARAAGEEIGTPWPQPLASDYPRYFREGDRLTYETAVGARQQRLTRAVVMAAVTAARDAGSGSVSGGEHQRWLDEVGDGVSLLCEQSSWSWAAHDDTFARFGHVVPTASEPYLDLGAGEVVAQLAWVDHVLGDRLDARIPGLRARIRHEAALRVFDPFTQRRDWWWIGDARPPMNWNAWIHGNIITAAVLLRDDAQSRAEIVALALEGLDRYVAELPGDGAVDEGFAYWWQGAARMLECLDFVSEATGGQVDARGIPVVREVLRFPLRMQLGADSDGTGWYYNVADGPATLTGTEPWHIPFRWGTSVGDADAARHAQSARSHGHPVVDVTAGLGRVLHALADSDWHDADATEPPLPQRVWLPSVQVMIARERAGDASGLALAVKGGHNDENHNHKDVGSFVVALDGHPLVVDAGQPTYTAQTFGDDRYGLRVMQSGWHNAPAPFGLEQGEGVEFRARLLSDPVHTPAGRGAGEERARVSRPGEPARPPTAAVDTVAFELAGAYPLQPGDSWRRRMSLDRAHSRVTIEDEWALRAPPVAEPTVVHLLLAGEVTIDGSRARVVCGGVASALLIDWGDEQIAARWERWMLEDPRLERVWGASLTRLTLTVPDAVGTLITTIEGER